MATVLVTILNSFDDECFLLLLPAHTTLGELRCAIRSRLGLPENQTFDFLDIVFGSIGPQILRFNDETKGFDAWTLSEVECNSDHRGLICAEVFEPSHRPTDAAVEKA